jgi:integrase
VAIHAQEALSLAGITATEATMPTLIDAMGPMVHAAYKSAEVQDRAEDDRSPVDLLAVARHVYPKAQGLLAPVTPTILTFDEIWNAWSKVTTTNPKTIHETRGMLRMLSEFLGHENAAEVTRAELLRWRDDLKAQGLSNNTWNNRLSLIGQVFKRAMADDRIPVDPTVGLRLEKGQGAKRLPYSDEEAVAILQAARREAHASLRWAHWIMALSGMSAGEVLQLTGGDIFQDPRSGIWCMEV